MNSIIDQNRDNEYFGIDPKSHKPQINTFINPGCLREDKICTFFPRLEDCECDFMKTDQITPKWKSIHRR